MYKGYTLIKAKRKTIAIRITKEGEVVVRCPMRMTKLQAEAFVQQHMDWINKNLAEVCKRKNEKESFTAGDGSVVYYLGEEYVIRLSEKSDKVVLSGREIIIPANAKDKKSALLEFFRQQSKLILPQLVQKWSDVMSVTPRSVKITSAKTRWGSCSGKNGICFSLRLICLPVEVIEYVVVHELCHIKHHNHSTAFYAMVESFLPDYKEKIKLMRTFKLQI